MDSVPTRSSHSRGWCTRGLASTSSAASHGAIAPASATWHQNATRRMPTRRWLSGSQVLNRGQEQQPAELHQHVAREGVDLVHGHLAQSRKARPASGDLSCTALPVDSTQTRSHTAVPPAPSSVPSPEHDLSSPRVHALWKSILPYFSPRFASSGSTLGSATAEARVQDHRVLAAAALEDVVAEGAWRSSGRRSRSP